MEKVKDDFTKFYIHNFKNRQIVWLYNHGSLQLETTYLQKRYQVVVTVFQAAILCLFNDNKSLTYKQIQERLQLADGDMTESLLKLCAPRT